MRKIKKAKTDSVSAGVTAEMSVLTDDGYGGADARSSTERWDHTMRPEAANLLGLYGLATGATCR